MFNVSRFSKKPTKFLFNQDYINESTEKYNKLMIETNKDIKKKKNIKKILYDNKLSKTTNHYVNDLINNSKYYNFIFIVSFISLGVSSFIFYKSR